MPSWQFVWVGGLELVVVAVDGVGSCFRVGDNLELVVRLELVVI